MCRVAAVAQMITDNWKSVLPNNTEIVKACLIHDIAKPITFDPTKQHLYINDPNDLNDVLDVINYLRSKYGLVEHEALSKICVELDLSETVKNIVDLGEWNNTSLLVEKNNILPLILIYSDMRIGPDGLMNLEDRLNNLILREPQKKAEIESLRQNVIEMENYLQRHTNIYLKDIPKNEVEIIAQNYLLP